MEYDNPHHHMVAAGVTAGLVGKAAYHNSHHAYPQSKKRKEEHGMEPHGHGNTPATGTEQAGYIPRYVPVNFPDKFTIKEKFCELYEFRSAAQSGGVPTQAWALWNTNSTFAVLNTSTNVGTNLATGHSQPNQRDNWTAQYGYYRVESMDYRIHCTALEAQTFTETAAPGPYAYATAVSDGILTLMPTQTASDVTNSGMEALWEQKQSQNHYIQGRSGGTSNHHVFHGTINPEDYDIDPITTAGDETWTAIGTSPTQPRLLGLSLTVGNIHNTISLLPECAVNVFVEFTFTVQYAGYKTNLRQASS